MLDEKLVKEIIKETIDLYINPSLAIHNSFCVLKNIMIFKKVIILEMEFGSNCTSCHAIESTSEMIENLIQEELKENDINYRIHIKSENKDSTTLEKFKD